MSITRREIGARMSQCVVHGDTIYLAGQTAGEPDSSVTEQTEKILDRIEGLLAAVGSDKSRLLSATIWLSDMAYFEEMNRVWDAWVSPGDTPARACVEARLARPHLKVEIMVMAAR